MELENKTERSGYENYIPELEKRQLLSWHEKWFHAWEAFQKTWQAKYLKNNEKFCLKLDELIARKGMPFTGFLSLRQLITWYNVETNFADFKGLTEVRSMVAGFGGTGGQKLDYHFSEDGYHCYGSTYIGGEQTKKWDKTDPLWFATHICTPEQDNLIAFFERH